MKALVVLSGGMDSAVALAHTVMVYGTENVSTITFNYGSKHNLKENEAAKKLAQHYNVPNTLVELPFINELFKSDLLKTGGEIPDGHYADPSMKKTVVPFRNGIMLAIAIGYAESVGIKNVYIGNHSGDHAIYPDCRLNFIVPFAEAATAGTYNGVSLKSPFCEMTKTDIASYGSRMGVPFEITYSCYKGGDNHCGKCGTCFERKEAFRESVTVDPTSYAE